IADIVRQGRLAWRLLWDSRVPFWTKLIPPAVLLYLVSPVDFLPDAALGLGQLDDLAILLIGTKLFIELAPIEIVREHLAELGARIQEWRVDDGKEAPPQIIEGEFEAAESDDAFVDAPAEIEDAEIVEVVEAEEVEAMETEEVEVEEV
ncbi:MAG: YkvA family protein, partial [Anaerolineae bacterium]